MNKVTLRTIDTPLDGDGTPFRDARKRAGLSTKKAAAVLGLSRVTLNRYENGHRAPDVNTLKAMASAYGSDLSALTSGEATEQPIPVQVRGSFVDRTHFRVDFEKDPEESLPFLTCNHGVFALKVIGSGMEPVAHHNEYIILEKPPPTPFLQMSQTDAGLEMIGGESVGKVMGFYRKARA